jgi:DNA helicase IV
VNNTDRAAEHAYLEKIRALLKTRVTLLQRKATGHETDIEESGYKMWDELTHVIRDFDDVAALTLYDMDIARHDDDYRNTLVELRNTLSLYRIPYFGRLDFVSDRDGYREEG